MNDAVEVKADKDVSQCLDKMLSELQDINQSQKIIQSILIEQGDKLETIDQSIIETGKCMDESTKSLNKIEKYIKGVDKKKLLLAGILGGSLIPLVGLKVGLIASAGTFIASKL